jgi:hydroxyacylglutathione hydrolase
LIAGDSVTRIVNREYASNTYLCRADDPGTCVLIDPGLDREEIEAALQGLRMVPKAIFCTHGHPDHIGSAEYFRLKHAVPLHIHGADVKTAHTSNFLLMSFRSSSRVVVPEAWEVIDEGFSWSLGVPGHTPGSIVLRTGGRAFAGDTILRVDDWLGSLPDASRHQMAESVRRLWTLLPDDTLIYPGHGEVETFRQVKQSNARLRRMLDFKGAALP